MKTGNDKSEFKFVVGIGASAGGLEALQKFLNALAPNTGFPYIIVQHLSPDYKSLLGEILGKYTDMPVIQAEDGMKIEANHVYIIQPGKNMKIENNTLHMTNQVPKELNLPIDIFFRSLAEDAKSHAIAIVLSGTGSDGTNGIKAIKENDGMVIVQDISTSKFDGMPRSAMRTGIVDAQISPEEIALELEHIADKVAEPSHSINEKEIDAEQMRRVYSILKKISNINFTHYKPTTIIRRMERRMMLTHKDNLTDYVEHLYETPEEVRILSKEVLIGVTNFFRDPEFFQCLKDKAIVEIINHGTPDEPIRVWVAGCSTGEEAYSVAILISETMESLKVKRSVKIFATDLDAESIAIAAKGVYGDNIIDSVSAVRLSRYFTRRNNTYTINRDIRKMIVFSPHNVFQDPPFGRLDLISCRNMLIYFQPVLQNDLFAIFHQALKDNGYLFLGKSEAIGAYTEAFPVVDAASKLFSHRSDVRIPGAKTVPYLQTTYLDDEYVGDNDEGFPRSSFHKEETNDEFDTVNNSLLEKFMPACLVVNEKNELVHSYGDNSNFVHLTPGKYSNILFDNISDGLKIPVSTLLKKSRKEQSEVQYKDIHFDGERKKSIVSLTVMPISNKNELGKGLYALIFDERGVAKELTEQAETYNIDKVASQRITDLEQELSNIQGKLDKSVAEQECVNEELQAANEELLTANEELQSSNEELQSVNEELYTVNSEYQQKLSELNDLNDDIANFLTSTLTGIIFVDNKLNIRRYTDYVTSEFSVMDHDIGRSLAFISYHFPSIDITEICTDVLKTLIPDEREVTTNKNKVFFMRVAPYRSTENKIMGCVITLMDVTSQKQGMVTLQNTEKQLTMAQQASEAKSDYLSRIAHEIKAPMLSLISLSKHAKSVDGKEESDKDLEKIINTIDYMSSIVTDISEASLSERLAGEQVMEPFSLQAVLDTIAAIMEPMIQNTKLNLKLITDGELDNEYIGNKNKIQQILINFLNNSVKYTPEGGSVSLQVYEKSRRNGKACICFVITDTGIGIKKKNISKLFKPFTHEDEDASNAPIAMGLGLSIAYNLITSMHGDVSVESAEGRGSTFTINVMLDCVNEDGEKDKAIPSSEPNNHNLSGCNILIAEDNALNRTILETMLDNEGMTYAEAVNGEEAYKTFAASPENSFDCILMDMRMPKLDGIKATEKIRSAIRSDAKTVPIIGVSANGYAEDVQQARNAGIDDYITKPIDREALLRAMSRLIKHKPAAEN